MNNYSQVDTMNLDDPLVCATHGRHIPCRTEHECAETSDPDWVDAVTAYHRQKVFNDWNDFVVDWALTHWSV